jgi:hypothetical protein
MKLKNQSPGAKGAVEPVEKFLSIINQLTFVMGKIFLSEAYKLIIYVLF